MIIVGGGYIAVEFATIFHGLGSEVTELYRGELFLRGFDIDVRQVLADEMRKREVDLRFHADVSRIEKTPHGIKATLNDRSELEADIIMYATGRSPNSKGLGLEGPPALRRTKSARCVWTPTRGPTSLISTLLEISPTGST